MFHLADATFSNARSASPLKNVSHASLCQNARLTSLLQRTSLPALLPWFMKLPAGSIEKWVDLEKLFPDQVQHHTSD